MALTTKIREYREKQGLTQSELADLVGVRRETIVNLERGRYNPSLKLAMDIAKVFHVTVERYFPIRNKKTPTYPAQVSPQERSHPRRIQKRKYRL